ncbi:hypothetical protein [Limnovirga soli]|uniref:Uncharacterized protein n=1 Tax=Limnovirga soli TaxID=2656915 RepID=A0A8J8FH91_9BACT|nr:hypothetical protein [Limnovirga soli]NNV55029.1 hypothetical protein [Limnovirga soli]
MATKEQYDFFKDQFVEEEKRYSDLTKRGEIYFSILSILLTGVIFKIKDIFEILKVLDNATFKTVLIGLFVLSFLLFSLGFFFITLGLKIREFEGVTDIKSYLDSLGGTPPTNEDFFDDRIVDFITASERNESVNDLRANRLSISLGFILAGFISMAVFIFTLFIQIL